VPAEIDRDYLKTRPAKALQRLVCHTFLQGRPLTTKGQWFNKVIAAQFAMAKRLPGHREPASPILILGTGRSGTTILGKVLSMHKDCVFLNEAKALWHAAYPREDVIGTYSNAEASYVLDASDATPDYRRSLNRLYAYSRCLAGKSALKGKSSGGRVVDKYPELIFRLPFVQAACPAMKPVLLVRNGNDTLTSITKWSQQAGVESDGRIDDWWGRDRRKWKLLVRDVVTRDALLAKHAEVIKDFTRHEDMAAVEWIVTMRQGLETQDEFGTHLIRFEDLCSNPRKVLAELCVFTELATDETFLAYADRTLSPVPERETAELHPLIQPAFDGTMKQLGYA